MPAKHLRLSAAAPCRQLPQFDKLDDVTLRGQITPKAGILETAIVPIARVDTSSLESPK